jgi:hypothetical protein
MELEHSQPLVRFSFFRGCFLDFNDYSYSFKKTETYHPSSAAIAMQFNIKPTLSTMGTSGPIHISEPGLIPPYTGGCKFLPQVVQARY